MDYEEIHKSAMRLQCTASEVGFETATAMIVKYVGTALQKCDAD
jgi:hypothetical protein